MTQGLIASMLGVRREGVTEAAGKLQDAGLIRYRRGRITLLDRPGLEGALLAAGGVRQIPLRILIADDSAAVRDSLARLLEDMGHQVRGAEDGVEAVELAQRWMPDFVLLDIHMPKLNGVMAARALRAQFPSTLMRLVMMSGITLDEEILEGAKAAGFDSCIDKVYALAGLEKLFKSIDV